MYDQLFRVTLFAVALIASTVTHGAGLIIFERGVGGITATAKFDRKYIAPLVPGYALRAGQRATKGESYRVIGNHGWQGGHRDHFARQCGKKLSIRITSPKITNVLGPKIGATYASIFGSSPTRDCTPGQEELSGKVICPRRGSNHVAYVLMGKSDGFDGVLPSPKALANFTVEEIVWRR